MGVIIHQKQNVIGEARLKLAYVRRHVSDIMDLLAPSSALPKYKTALGFNQSLKYEKMREQKSILLGLILVPIMSLFGGYMLDHDSHDPLAYFPVIWAIVVSILLGWTMHIKNEEQDKKLEDMKREFDETVTDLRVKFDEKIADLRLEFDEKLENMRKEQNNKIT